MVLGQVDEQGLRYTVRSLGTFASVEALGELVIDDRGLRLADIAEISYEEPPISYGRHLDGQYADRPRRLQGVHRQHGRGGPRGAAACSRRRSTAIRCSQGVNLFVWEDQAEEITSGIDGLRTAGLIGALLAILSLYFFLRRLDSTVIVSLSIPFSLIATCGVMYFPAATSTCCR